MNLARYSLAKRASIYYLSLILLFILSGPVYAVTATGIQSPDNDVIEGINPTYAITVNNPDSQDTSITIRILRDQTDISTSFSSTDCTAATDGSFSCATFDSQQLPPLPAGGTATYNFQWLTPPLADTYNLTFFVDCTFDGECIDASVEITTVVVAAPIPPPIPTDGFPELTGLTDSEQSVYDSFQAACEALTANSDEVNSDDLAARDDQLGEDNLRQACEALEVADVTTLTNAVRQLTPKQAPAQGTTSIEVYNRQFDNITSRMTALRSGATGISAAGLSMNYKGLSLPGSLFTDYTDTPSGGSAGSDNTLLIGKLGIFINGSVSFGDKDSSRDELGFDIDTKGLTAGADYRFTNKFVMGAAVGYVDNDTDFDGDRGDMDVDGYTLSVYSTYYHDENSYLDAIASVGWNDYDNSRAVAVGAGIPDREVKGDTDSLEYALSIGGGYDFNHRGISFGPTARINYINTDIDSYTEDTSTGFELDYESQEVESLTTMLGGQLSYPISTSIGIFTPQFRFEWAHEFKDDNRFISARFLDDPTSTSFSLRTDHPDRNYFNLGTGLAATFAEGKSAFIYYETVVKQQDISQHSLSAGMRFTF